MHDLPDTDDADAAAERYWPEEYKEIIRTHLSRIISARLQEDKAFSGVYERGYKDRFDSYGRFADRLACGLVEWVDYCLPRSISNSGHARDNDAD